MAEENDAKIRCFKPVNIKFNFDDKLSINFVHDIYTANTVNFEGAEMAWISINFAAFEGIKTAHRRSKCSLNCHFLLVTFLRVQKCQYLIKL